MSDDPTGPLERELERAHRTRAVVEELASVHAKAMHAIHGLTEDLIAHTMTVEQRDLLDRVRANVEHVRAFLDDFLDLARLDAGSMELADAPFGLREVIEASLDLVVPIAQQKHVELVCDLDVALPERAAGDAPRIGRILGSLLNNALEHTHKGEVRVRARLVEHDDIPMLELTVEDTGIGISKEELPRVFDRFGPVGNAEAPSSNRLGLALVRSLASQAGGSAKASSVLGVGSTFSARVPVRVLEDDAAHDRKLRYKGIVVAVVMPSKNTREAVAKLLTRQGATVVEASRWGELERENALGLDAILLDLGILDIAHALRARSSEPLHSVPLLVLSTLAENEVATIKAIGAASVVGRPVRETRLFATLDRVLGSAKQSPTPIRAVAQVGSPAVVRPRALLVEDDPDNRLLLLRTCTRLGYAVTAVEDGELGLARAKAFVYDVIVTDVMMPRRNGPDMVSAIRAFEVEHGRLPTPIIAMTACSFDSTRDACERAGMNAVLFKPLKTSLLESALAEHVDHRAAVLCVDDSPESRTLMTHFLDPKAVRVVHADGAAQAIERTEHERVDVILMDLEMPGVNGFELAAMLRGSQTHASTPIIAVTGHDEQKIHKRCRDIGFTDILVKPFSRATLQAIVGRYSPRPLAFAQATETGEKAKTAPSRGDVAYVGDDVLDLVPKFLESRRTDVTRLRKAIDVNDRESVRKIGHAMRGSGGGYGFDAITRIGALLESSAIAGDDEAVRRSISELDAYLEHVRIEVRRD